jgi:PTS system ascorbate-specific IIA component
MIGILLITHGTLGEALLQNVCHILGQRPPLLAQLGVAAQDDPLAVLSLAQHGLRQVDGGAGVLVMTDIFGATPSNVATRLLAPGKVEGVSGLSLPMLLRALTYREKDLETMADKAISGACDGALKLQRED